MYLNKTADLYLELSKFGNKMVAAHWTMDNYEWGCCGAEQGFSAERHWKKVSPKIK